MKLEKLTPKKIKDLPLGKKYHIETRKGEFLIGELGIASADSDNPIYFFSGDFGRYDSDSIINFAPHVEFSYISVGDGFVLTKNGNKIFPENIYGVISDEQYAQHYVHNMNCNVNTLTSDAIQNNDIVEIIFGDLRGKQAIVTKLRKPVDIEDHGLVEVFLLNERYFEHFTYSNWDKCLKVVEKY